MKKTKRMMDGGMTASVPAAAAAGLARRPVVPGAAVPAGVPAAPATVPVQGVGMRPDMTGLDRAAAMSGRTMPVPGVGMRPAGMKKGGAAGSASKRADGIAIKGKTRGKIY